MRLEHSFKTSSESTQTTHLKPNRERFSEAVPSHCPLVTRQLQLSVPAGPRASANCRGIAVVSSDIVLRRACRSECDPCVPWCACVCWSWCRGPPQEALKQNSTV
eukprot:scaffold1147_cov125-Isochrysis_galbana.AAC.2